LETGDKSAYCIRNATRLVRLLALHRRQVSFCGRGDSHGVQLAIQQEKSRLPDDR
jgi:hypothetical protein